MTREIKMNSVIDGELQIGDYTLPSVGGTAGQSFIADGAGAVSWDNVAIDNLEDITNNTIVGNLSGGATTPTEIDVTVDLTSSAAADELVTGLAVKTYVDTEIANAGGGGSGAFVAVDGTFNYIGEVGGSSYDYDFVVGAPSYAVSAAAADTPTLSWEKEVGALYSGTNLFVLNGPTNSLIVGSMLMTNTSTSHVLFTGQGSDQTAIMCDREPGTLARSGGMYYSILSLSNNYFRYSYTSANSTSVLQTREAVDSPLNISWHSNSLVKVKAIARYYGSATNYVGFFEGECTIAEYNNTKEIVHQNVTLVSENPSGWGGWDFTFTLTGNTLDIECSTVQMCIWSFDIEVLDSYFNIT